MIVINYTKVVEKRVDCNNIKLNNNCNSNIVMVNGYHETTTESNVEVSFLSLPSSAAC